MKKEDLKISLQLLPRNEGPMAAFTIPPVIEARSIDLDMTPHADRKNATEFTVAILTQDFSVISEDISKNDRDRIEILLKDRILNSNAYPTIIYRGTLMPDSDEQFLTQGILYFRGIEREMDLNFISDPGGFFEAKTEIVQTVYGIKPVSAFMSALRSTDEVGIRVRVWKQPRETV